MNFALDYIKEFEDAAQTEAKLRQNRRAHIDQAARKAVDQAIADLFGDDAPVSSFKAEADRDDQFSEGWRAVTIDGLTPFYMVAAPIWNNGDNNKPEFSLHLTDINPAERRHHSPYRPARIGLPADTAAPLADDTRLELGKFLKARQEAHQAQLDQRAKERAEAIARKINETRENFRRHYLSTAFPKTRAEAETIVAQLIDLAPERREELEALLPQWDETYQHHLVQQDEQRRETAENERRKAQYEATKEAYRAAYAAYWAEKTAVQERNAAKVEALQTRWDTPFTTYSLEYALVAVDEEDGERYLETKTVTCLHPMAGDYHRALRYGKVTPKAFSHPVSTTAPVEVKPTTARSGAVCIDIGKYTGVYEQGICYSPESDREAVDADIAATFEFVPQPPGKPDTLAWNDVRTIEGRIETNDPTYQHNSNNYSY